jgi:molybdenum cofactor synthesis domain-containing protein
MRSAFVLTISDGVSAGARDDESGEVLAARLTELGFAVERAVSADDEGTIGRFVEGAAAEHLLVVTTGGTGLGPRDRTPEALRKLLDYDIPGFGEVMRAEGRRSTPFASLSRSFAGALQGTLVVALPGSPRGALESLEAVVPILDHALATLGGDTRRHPVETGADAARAGASVTGDLSH